MWWGAGFLIWQLTSPGDTAHAVETVGRIFRDQALHCRATGQEGSHGCGVLEPACDSSREPIARDFASQLWNHWLLDISQRGAFTPKSAKAKKQGWGFGSSGFFGVFFWRTLLEHYWVFSSMPIGWVISWLLGALDKYILIAFSGCWRAQKMVLEEVRRCSQQHYS